MDASSFRQGLTLNPLINHHGSDLSITLIACITPHWKGMKTITSRKLALPPPFRLID